MTPILDVASLTCPRRGLFDVSLRLHAGDRHAVVGPAAMGRALLDVVAGIDTPTSGSVRVAGRRVSGSVRAEDVRDRIGHLRTQPHPHTGPTLVAVLASAARGHRISGRRPSGLTDTEQATFALERFDLTGDRDTDLDQLPTGRRRLLDLAVLLIRRPTLLLLDQPLNCLTPDDRGLLVQVLDDLPESMAVLSTVTTRPDAATLAANITELSSPGQPGEQLAPGRAPVNGTRPDLPSPGGVSW